MGSRGAEAGGAQLARLVGPVARVMVQRAAASTTDVGMLYDILAEKLADGDRAAFHASAHEGENSVVDPTALPAPLEQRGMETAAVPEPVEQRLPVLAAPRRSPGAPGTACETG